MSHVSQRYNSFGDAELVGSIIAAIITIVGTLAFLAGLKKFFLDDVINTLHDIKDKLIALEIQSIKGP